MSTPLHDLPADQADGGKEGGRDITLRVLAFHSSGRWYAECIDLNLITRRDSLPAALSALREQIELYLTAAVETGQWEARVPRKAPIGDRLRYHVVLGLQILPRFIVQLKRYRVYRLPFDRLGHFIGA